MSDSGNLALAVRTSPQPPVRDCNDAQLTVTDKNGQPVTGLAVDVTPWMPDMGHGSAVVPTVTEQGNGVYEVDQLYLAMPGTWQLRTDLSSDHATPSFQIP